jgi:hypothetical protein
MKTAILILLASATAFAQEKFNSAEAAAKALINAAVSSNTTQLKEIFGPQADTLLSSGKSQQDQAERQEFASLAQSKHRLEQDSMNPNRMILCVGAQDWPFPVPIVHSNGVWMFDSSMGMEAMKARRIGADEMDAIEVSAGFVGLERTYAEQNADHHFASRIAELRGVAPQEFIAAAGDPPRAYHGYFFKILTAQGPQAAGGPHNYIVNGTMMGGFALVAWPAEYGVSGVNTFIVNQSGVVYEKDLGTSSNPATPPVTSFDPDRTWKTVN